MEVSDGNSDQVASSNQVSSSDQKNLETVPSQYEESSALLNGIGENRQQPIIITPTKIAIDDYDSNIPIQPEPGHGSSLNVKVVTGPLPPDGGLRAYMVMVGSFLCNGIIFGTINSGGIIFEALHKLLKEEGVEDAAAQASLTLSLAIGTTFFLSMVSGVLTDRLGIRATTIAGGVIATLGMFLSSLCFRQPVYLTLTMGVIFGTGASLAYTPSLVILGHYFNKHMGIVNGFVTAGSSVATVLITSLLDHVLGKYNLKTAFQILSGLMTILMVAGFVFKPLMPDLPRERAPHVDKNTCGSKCKTFWSQFINFEIWKNKKYVIWALAIPSALFGYFVPYVHLKAYSTKVLGEDANTAIIIQVLGGASGIGRLAFGFFADSPWVNRILLQQISFFCIGSLTMLLTVADNLYVFCAIAFGMGLFDGCFISLLGPIAFDIVGPAGASQAIGCLLALCALPLTLGPYLAGVMFDQLGNYFVPFLAAGVPPIMGCFALCFLRCVPEPEKAPIVSPAHDNQETKKKNNYALTPNSPIITSPEMETLVSDGDGGKIRPSSNEEEPLEIDVQRLLNLQRESSV